jgi:uncharacterized protein (DUF58 family)
VSPAAESSVALDRAEVLRAARLLSVRSRRETAGVLAGAYASAFRGGGIEFEELRPYAPGDDLRIFDWNATARTGEPFVKRFREERERTLLLLLDVSASMRFAAGGRAKAAQAARVAAVLAAAASRARDAVGLVAFDAAVRAEIPPARGPAHVWRVIRTAVECAGRSAGSTGLAIALAAARTRRLGRRRSVVFLLSDLRDETLLAPGTAAAAELTAVAARHELIAGILHDPREDELPDVGPIRVSDPERPGRRLVLDTGSARVRERYRAAAAARRRSLELRLRGAGADPLWLGTDRDPLRTLVKFFTLRTGATRLRL